VESADAAAMQRWPPWWCMNGWRSLPSMLGPHGYISHVLPPVVVLTHNAYATALPNLSREALQHPLSALKSLRCRQAVSFSQSTKKHAQGAQPRRS